MWCCPLFWTLDSYQSLPLGCQMAVSNQTSTMNSWFSLSHRWYYCSQLYTSLSCFYLVWLCYLYWVGKCEWKWHIPFLSCSTTSLFLLPLDWGQELFSTGSQKKKTRYRAKFYRQHIHERGIKATVTSHWDFGRFVITDALPVSVCFCWGKIYSKT